MQATRLFTVLLLLGVLLTIVLSASTWMDNDAEELNDDNHAISKRIFGHGSHGSHGSHGADASMNQGGCVRCKFSLARCCAPNICVKRRFRTDKCLRVKG